MNENDNADSLPGSEPVPAILLRVPELETGEAPIRVGCWFAELDDEVIGGSALLELIVPGVRVEIDAPVTGRLLRIARPTGSAVEAGTILAAIEPADSAQPESPELL